MDISVIEGQELGSVTFFADYVQLDFGGPLLTLYQTPEIFIAEATRELAEGSYAFGEPGYRDALCIQIGGDVEAASLEEGEVLEIKLENGTIFRVSLREDDLDGPEAGHLASGVTGDPLLVF